MAIPFTAPPSTSLILLTSELTASPTEVTLSSTTLVSVTPAPVVVGASFTAVIEVPMVLVAEAIAVAPPGVVVSTFTTVSVVPSHVVKPATYVSSSARTVSPVGVPLKLATGTKRSLVVEARALAVAPSATVPIACQFVPSDEYSHTPSVPALAVLPTTAMPPRPEPASTSEKLRDVSALIATPAGSAVSSSTAGIVVLPMPVGASFTAEIASDTLVSAE